MSVSVIISFYNKIEVLKLLIAGFERQSFKDFEIIIADDGSKNEVVESLNLIINNSSIAINHLWHKDNGWQKNIILNKAIQKARGEYLIFVDGDCIPHKHYVKDHYDNREENTILTGRRVKLSEKISKTLTTDLVSQGSLDKRFFSSVLMDSFFGKTKHIEKGFRLWGIIKQVYNRKKISREVLGCNFSLFKSELFTINGFDERYLGPGIGEDIDIDLRFCNNGGKIKLFKFGAIQYHVYHHILSRYDKENNLKIFKDNKELNIKATNFGINQS